MSETRIGSRKNRLGWRAGIALTQALILYLLAEASRQPLTWPATVPTLYVPAWQVACLIPAIALFGLDRLRPARLVQWAGAASLVIAGLGYHAAIRHDVLNDSSLGGLDWPVLLTTLPGLLFVAHVLVVEAVVAGRARPAYPALFDAAWKLALQILLAALFLGLFWLLLVLGAGLFSLLNIDIFQRIIQHRWFVYPASGLAVAVAIHVTDVEPGIIRGARSLLLSLCGALMPIQAAIGFGFLLVLPFSSATLLWRTHHAAGALLGVCAWLILLINCVYQDGGAATGPIKRLAARVACLELAPLLAVAAWALGQRVAEYGWSVQRLLSAAFALVLFCYAAGYGGSAIRRGKPWLSVIETTNFVAAYFTLVIGLALLSPIADPARLMVADQLSRLRSGQVTADKFDYVALKFDGAIWGKAALTSLTRPQDLPNDTLIQTNARLALALKFRANWGAENQVLSDDEKLARLKLTPPTLNLPASFRTALFWQVNVGHLPFCASNAAAGCSAQFVTLHPGAASILFQDYGDGYIFDADATQTWHLVGQVSLSQGCGSLGQALALGHFTTAPHPWPDLVVADRRLVITPPFEPCTPATRSRERAAAGQADPR